MRFKEITICLDMYGCPNRCRHCWLGVTPNGHMPVSEIEAAADGFRPFAEGVQVYDWYREPDFRDNYRELYGLCNRFSHRPIEHFELVSFWRLVRDKEYVEWLVSLGLKKAQLTIFGGEETTDHYIGRKGAYSEILEAIENILKILSGVLIMRIAAGPLGASFPFFCIKAPATGKMRNCMTSG